MEQIKMEQIKEIEESEKSDNAHRPKFSAILLAGLLLGVLSLLTWFLLSENVSGIGVSILVGALVLFALNYLLVRLTQPSRKWLKILLRILAALLSVLVLAGVAVYQIAPNMLFYPHFDEESYAALVGDPLAEELTIQNDNRVLSGWMLHNAEGKAPLVLYFGGNGENAATRIRKLIENDQTGFFSGCNFAFLDYPGYGKSSGTPSDASLRQMGLDAYDALAAREDVDSNRIVAFGYSMGTGVANYVAANRAVAGLVLMAPYADGYDLYNSIVDIFHGPLRLLVAFRMESVRFADTVAVEPLILASVDDQTVPFASSQRLSGAYPVGCDLAQFRGLGHNDFWGSDEVFVRIGDYIREVTEHGA